MRPWLKLTLGVIIVAILVLITGCGGILYPGTAGENSIKDDSFLSRIKKDETTTNDVKKILGEPLSVDRSLNGEIAWNYEYVRYWLGSIDRREAKVVFDRNGTVKDVIYSENR